VGQVRTPAWRKVLRRLVGGLAVLLLAGVVVAPAMTMAASIGSVGSHLASPLTGHALQTWHPDPIDPAGG
jgi:hypothetical protein